METMGRSTIQIPSFKIFSHSHRDGNENQPHLKFCNTLSLDVTCTAGALKMIAHVWHWCSACDFDFGGASCCKSHSRFLASTVPRHVLNIFSARNELQTRCSPSNASSHETLSSGIGKECDQKTSRIGDGEMLAGAAPATSTGAFQSKSKVTRTFVEICSLGC